MITTNYATNQPNIDSQLSFKAGGNSNAHLYEEMQKLTESLQPKENPVKKYAKKLNIGSAIKGAIDVIKASGYIATKFIWNRITTLLMCLWTIPGILASGAIIAFWPKLNGNFEEYFNNRINIENIDKKASKAEDLYETNPEKYNEKINSTIFDYYDAINQIKTEKDSLKSKISNLKK